MSSLHHFILILFLITINAQEQDLLHRHFLVRFIHKGQYPPILLGTGTLVTERYVITTAFPAIYIIRATTCALLGVWNELKVTKEFIIENCFNIKDLYLTTNYAEQRINFAIIELLQVRFNAFTTVATIPFSENYEIKEDASAGPHMAFYCDYDVQVNVSKVCLSFAYGPGKVPAGNLTAEQVNSQITMNGAKEFCVRTNGLPVSSGCVVVGLVAIEGKEAKCQSSTCLEDCISKSDWKFVNIFYDEIQAMLKKFLS